MKVGTLFPWAFTTAAAVTTFGLHLIASAQGEAPAEKVTRQFEQSLPIAPGKAFTTMIVTFPPGGRAAPHRHGQAFVYAYVLEGTVRSQLDDAPAKVYRAGEDWSEVPGVHHVLTENVSATEPARLLVVFVADAGAVLKVPDSR